MLQINHVLQDKETDLKVKHLTPVWQKKKNETLERESNLIHIFFPLRQLVPILLTKKY